jgi:hypothetical protein
VRHNNEDICNFWLKWTQNFSRITPIAAAANFAPVGPVRRTGRLKMIQDDGSSIGWLSKAIASTNVSITDSIGEALLVSAVISDKPQDLQLQVLWMIIVLPLSPYAFKNAIGDWKLLGICWFTGNPSAGSLNESVPFFWALYESDCNTYSRALLEGVKDGNSSSVRWDGTFFRGTTVWSLTSDGQITAQWTAFGGEKLHTPTTFGITLNSYNLGPFPLWFRVENSKSVKVVSSKSGYNGVQHAVSRKSSFHSFGTL